MGAWRASDSAGGDLSVHALKSIPVAGDLGQCFEFTAQRYRDAQLSEDHMKSSKKYPVRRRYRNDTADRLGLLRHVHA